MSNSIKLSAAVAAALLSSSALADGITWQYLDARYQQPSHGDVRGAAGQVSVNISQHWVMQGGIGHVRLKESNPDLKVSQTRFDVSVGRVFDLGNRASALLSAGYTHLKYEVDVGDFDDDADDNLGNVQLVLRALLVGPLEAEAGIGVLFDNDDTSDPLWNAGLRYRFSPSASVLLGANGIASDAFDSDEVLYELGFRFDLGEG